MNNTYNIAMLVRLADNVYLIGSGDMEDTSTAITFLSLDSSSSNDGHNVRDTLL